MKSCLVTLNYKDGRRSILQARRCVKYSSIEHVVVVDNNSPDNSCDIIQKGLCNKIELIKSPVNAGFASGNNFGAQYAISQYNPEYIIFANPDTCFADGDVSACINILENNPGIGLVSMRMKNVDGSEARSAWHFHCFSYYLFSHLWLYRHLTYKFDRYLSFEKKFQYVDIVRGSFMCFRTKALIDAGFFDTSTFLYYEEEIISKRLAKAGYKVGLVTDHWYTHDQIGNDSEPNTFLQKNYDRSLTIFLTKYYNINFIQKWLLNLFINYSHIEYSFIQFIKRIF